MLGGPVDYSAPLTTITAAPSGSPPSLAWADPTPLPLGSDATFAVRTVDTISGLEDQNRDARIRIVTHAITAADLSNRPARPSAVSAAPISATTLRVIWSQGPAQSPAGRPTGFRIWATLLPGGTPGPVDYSASPAATIPAGYSPSAPAWTADLAGLTAGGVYAIGVRAFNATGDDGGSDTPALMVAMPGSGGPAAVGGLSAGGAGGPGY